MWVYGKVPTFWHACLTQTTVSTNFSLRDLSTLKDVFPEKAMASHFSTLAWKIPWTEEPGGLQSMGSWRVGHNWATSLSLFTFMFWRGNGNPFQCSCLENPRDGGTWWTAVYGVAQSRTRLKRLSSSSSSSSVYMSMLLSKLIPPSPSSTVFKSPFSTQYLLLSWK